MEKIEGLSDYNDYQLVDTSKGVEFVPPDKVVPTVMADCEAIEEQLAQSDSIFGDIVRGFRCSDQVRRELDKEAAVETDPLRKKALMEMSAAYLIDSILAEVEKRR